MVTTAGCARLVDSWELDARRGFGGEALRVGFESEDFMDSLNFGLLLADTTGLMSLVSSIRARLVVLLLLFLSSGLSAQSGSPVKSGAAEAQAARDPQKLFEAGEAALRVGKLDEAEREFRQVLAIRADVAGAYVNLGVIDMRRKQWPQALEMLHKAEKLAPDMAGIRLNIGLVYYRERNFPSAIGPFESVVRQTPQSYQARYLLGFCYFFDGRWADTVATLVPLWEQVSAPDRLHYLYVLGRAAELSKNAALAERAYARMAEIGQGSPEFHMIIGKSHLNRGEYDAAVRELEAAAEADPKLPLAHYYLGVTYVRKQDYERARAEFQKDLAVEPDAAFTYEQLGKIEATLQNDAEAAKDFGRAVKLDPLLLESRLGLAKIAERKKEYPAALAQLDEIIRLDQNSANSRYLRGQVLLRMGREKEGREELAVATRMLNEQRAARHKELEGEAVPSPELTREPD
jgi:tetratricopeptide (TPR) repeat protein